MPIPQPLRFSTHHFALFCYAVSDVRVTYAGRAHELWDEGGPAPAKTAADATRYPNAQFGVYEAFEGPVQARWRAQDGSALSWDVDLEQVFPDRTVLHGADPQRIYAPIPLTGGRPVLIVELNDRTLNIYMDVTVQTVPASAAATKRDETEYRTLAYSHTLG
jgi:hypothetical protein